MSYTPEINCGIYLPAMCPHLISFVGCWHIGKMIYYYAASPNIHFVVIKFSELSDIKVEIYWRIAETHSAEI